MKKLIACLLLSLCFNSSAFAKEKIELVMPWAAGGSSDLYARRISQILSNGSSPINVEVINKVGANGKIAYNYFAQQKKAMMIEVAGIISQANSDDYPKNLLQNIQPLFFAADPPRLIYTSLPVNSFSHLRELSKTTEILFGASNPGSSSYAVYDWLCNRSKLLEKCNVIFYRGTGHAMPDVLAGRIHLYTAAYNTVVHSGFTSGGKSKEVLVLSLTTLTALPTVPTLANISDNSVPFDIVDWHGLFHIGLSQSETAFIKDQLKNVYKLDWFINEGYGRLDNISPAEFFKEQINKLGTK